MCKCKIREKNTFNNMEKQLVKKTLISVGIYIDIYMCLQTQFTVFTVTEELESSVFGAEIPPLLSVILKYF